MTPYKLNFDYVLNPPPDEYQNQLISTGIDDDHDQDSTVLALVNRVQV